MNGKLNFREHLKNMFIRNIIYRDIWLGKNYKLLIKDLIVNIILNYFKKTMQNLFTISTNIQGGAV